MTNKKSVWATLSAIDCSAKVEQKGKLPTYHGHGHGKP